MKLDLLIIGGGPAGAAAAITAARIGWRVALVERTTYDEVRIGETFAPDIRLPLVRLGVWERFAAAGHLASPGIVSCWGGAEPFENDFIFDPYGSGWHVDRVRFDRMLADAARDVGAQLLTATEVKECRRSDEHWVLKCRRGDEWIELRAPLLIDAAGRRPIPGNAAFERRRQYDRLLGIAAFFTARAALPPTDPRTLIEAERDGWWYSALLPDQKLVIALMTDPDLAAAPTEYPRRLQQTALTRRRLDDFELIVPPRRFAASTYFTERPVSADRLAVGDAAMAFDPLSSQGVARALTTGRQAVEVMLAARTGNADAPEHYLRSLKLTFDKYLLKRTHYYRTETRWPDAPFWRRRHDESHHLSLAI